MEAATGAAGDRTGKKSQINLNLMSDLKCSRHNRRDAQPDDNDDDNLFIKFDRENENENDGGRNVQKQEVGRVVVKLRVEIQKDNSGGDLGRVLLSDA